MLRSRPCPPVGGVVILASVLIAMLAACHGGPPVYGATIDGWEIDPTVAIPGT